VPSANRRKLWGWSPAAFIVHGRVAAESDFKELHESIKHDIVSSMRIMASGDIARLDLL
jgi:hypothetical protein